MGNNALAGLAKTDNNFNLYGMFNINGEIYQRGILLGGGHYGNVYYAEKDGASYAIKEFNNLTSRKLPPNRVERWSELKGIPGVTQLYHNGEVHQNLPAMNGSFATVMDYVHGENLAEVLEHEGSLPEEQLRAITKAVARRIQGLHGRSLVHRDIRAENILISTYGFVFLTDFDYLVKEGHVQTKNRGYKGKVAPEQFPFIGNPYVVHRSADIYPLGIIIREMMAGYDGAKDAPFGNYSRDLVTVHENMLRLDPNDRPTIGEVIERLTA
jgi:serine/threonine protein kinase